MSIDLQYQDLLKDIIENGCKKMDRTGTGTISVFGRQIRHKMKDGFPLLTTKKMYWKGIIVELLWFLNGDTNIKYLIENDCHIWNGDAYKKYELVAHGNLSKEEFIDLIKSDKDFCDVWGNLGPVYGKQWRSWTNNSTGKPIDQISNLIKDLKFNPDSRRLIVNSWNVGELEEMTLPPCHYSFQMYTSEIDHSSRISYWFHNNKPNRDVVEYFDNIEMNQQIKYLDSLQVPKRYLSLMWNQRSVDTFLGLPFNIASYAMLLEIIAHDVNMIPDELIGNLGDTHLYLNHLDQAKEQISRTDFKLPTFEILNREKIIKEKISNKYSDFKISNYVSHGSIKAPLSN